MITLSFLLGAMTVLAIDHVICVRHNRKRHRDALARMRGERNP